MGRAMSTSTSGSQESAIVLAPASPLAENVEPSLEQAFRATLPELLTLPKDQLLSVNLDIRNAICLGLAATTRLAAWRNRIVDELPRFDIKAVDSLGIYAMALMYAETQYNLARKRPADIRALTNKKAKPASLSSNSMILTPKSCSS